MNRISSRKRIMCKDNFKRSCLIQTKYSSSGTKSIKIRSRISFLSINLTGKLAIKNKKAQGNWSNGLRRSLVSLKMKIGLKPLLKTVIRHFWNSSKKITERSSETTSRTFWSFHLNSTKRKWTLWKSLAYWGIQIMTIIQHQRCRWFQMLRKTKWYSALTPSCLCWIQLATISSRASSCSAESNQLLIKPTILKY